MEAHEYTKTGKHLPYFLRDFHDQKDLFKTIHYLYAQDENAEEKPNWVQGQIYVIDWFLWFMAQRGYTLQKTRKKNVKFKNLMQDIKERKDLERKIGLQILGGK